MGCHSKSIEITMTISYNYTVSRYTHLTEVRFLSCMYAHVLLEMFRINERRCAYFAFVRPLAGVRRFYVIIQQSSPLKSFPAIVALVPFVVVMRRALMGLQIRPLATELQKCSK